MDTCEAVLYTMTVTSALVNMQLDKHTAVITSQLQSKHLFKEEYPLAPKVHYSTTTRFCMHIVKIFAFKNDFSLHYSTTLWFGMGLPKMFIWLEGTLQHYTVILHTYPENKRL